jgi:hypothetical protein
LDLINKVIAFLYYSYILLLKDHMKKHLLVFLLEAILSYPFSEPI